MNKDLKIENPDVIYTNTVCPNPSTPLVLSSNYKKILTISREGKFYDGDNNELDNPYQICTILSEWALEMGKQSIFGYNY